MATMVGCFVGESAIMPHEVRHRGWTRRRHVLVTAAAVVLRPTRAPARVTSGGVRCPSTVALPIGERVPPPPVIETTWPGPGCVNVWRSPRRHRRRQRRTHESRQPLVESLLDLLAGYGGVDEINRRAAEAARLETRLVRLREGTRPTSRVSSGWMSKREAGAFVSLPDYRAGCSARRRTAPTSTRPAP